MDQVNALNVFPVPDGDTGSNMLATVRAALAEAERIPPGQRRLWRVAEALSFGALMGARGNSGLILSQVLRGMSEVAHDKHRVDGLDLGHALKRGAEAAYAAVGQPVEGTILTVAREAADAATGAGEWHVESVLTSAVDGAERSVARTPSLLPALREAGVVDSGGHGLFLLLRGLLLDLAEEGDVAGQAVALPNPLAPPLVPSHETQGYGYETMFVLRPTGAPLDLTSVRADLQRLGESVMVAGDERLANIHVHNGQPDAVVAYGLQLGSLSQITIQNLDEQIAEPAGKLTGHRVSRALGAADGDAAAPALDRSGVNAVVVAPGDGLARTFKAAGATTTVRGGATSNPSTEELIEAIRSCPAEGIILLTNHRNVVLVARQAAELATDHRVALIETRNPAEGVAAMLALDARRDLDTNAAQMRAAAAAVQTLQVTRAVRDARMAGRSVRQGETLVLDADERLVAAGDDRVEAVLEGIGALRGGYELLTLYSGMGVDGVEADELRQRITERQPAVEVEIVDGGQPYYAYLIAAE